MALGFRVFAFGFRASGLGFRRFRVYGKNACVRHKPLFFLGGGGREGGRGVESQLERQGQSPKPLWKSGSGSSDGSGGLLAELGLLFADLEVQGLGFRV